MSVTVENRRNRSRSATAAALTVLLLAPLGILFARVWGTTSDDRTAVLKELQGVEYLTRLGPLVTVLAELQASAMQGTKTAPTDLQEVVNGVAEVDKRLGARLGTSARWADLRAKIDGLPAVTGDPAAVYQAHVGAGGLLLALFTSVRDKSGLLRDPDNDVSHLQQALGADLPEATTAINQMGDLSLALARAKPPQQQLALMFGASIEDVADAVDELTENLKAAVADTSSRTLSSSIIRPLDTFRRGIEALTHSANPGGRPDEAAMVVGRTQMRQNLNAIDNTILREMDALLRSRLDDIDANRREALLVAGVAILITLLALAAISGVVVRLRRGTTPPDARGDGQARVEGPGRTGPDRSVAAPGYGPSFHDPVPQLGHEVPPTRREQFGALR